MDFPVLLHDYGWAAVLIIFMIDRFWPWFSEKYIPSKQAQRKTEQERLEKLEERQVSAFERVAEIQNEMSKQIVAINERLAVIITGHVEHDRAMMAGFERTRPLPQARARKDPAP